MADFNWCHGPQCHEKHTVDRVRGVKGSKVLRTRKIKINNWNRNCLLYTSPSPRDYAASRMPSSA